MTKEEKQLLLKDLCARLPYGIIASVRGSDEEFQYFHILGVKDGKVWVKNDMLCVDDFDDVEVVKPYLRPMSSMTENEKKDLLNYIVGEEASKYFVVCDGGSIMDKNPDVQEGKSFKREWINFNPNNSMWYIDWLNAHHFDYRNLIEKGLALVAPEDMYQDIVL